MTTIHHPTTEVSTQGTTPGEPSSRSVMVVIVGVVALLLGGAVGWMIGADDGGEAADIVVAGGGELTSRHEQMVEFHRDYLDPWETGDVEAIRAMFVPDGTLSFNDVTYDVASPEFADFVAFAGLGTTSVLVEPHLVIDNTMFNFVTVAGYRSENILRFTRSGELLLRDHIIINTALT